MKAGGWRVMALQSTLSKADTLGTKATVRFRESSYYLIPEPPNWNLGFRTSVQWPHDGPDASLLAVLTEPNTAHTNWYIILHPETYLSSDCAILTSVINLCKHPVSVLRNFRTKILKKSVRCPAWRGVRLRESSVTERKVKFGRDKICCPV